MGAKSLFCNPPIPKAPAGKSMTARIPVPEDYDQQIERALREDIGSGDLTASLIPADAWGHAAIITREPAILCGIPYVEGTFARLDPAVRIEWDVAEGGAVSANQTLCRLSGPARALLTGERTALNFLQLLSATATATHAYARKLQGTGCRLLDTRKTLPGLRTAQKYAVRVGGGQNHRIGLYDGILIKENHIMAAGGIARAVSAARAAAAAATAAAAAGTAGGHAPAQVPVEVEVETLAELREAIDAEADIALLDEFSLAALTEAVAVNRAARRPLKLEASGGVSLESIRAIAETGVDYVSVGGITKHVRAIDLSMRFDAPR